MKEDHKYNDMSSVFWISTSTDDLDYKFKYYIPIEKADRHIKPNKIVMLAKKDVSDTW